MKKILIVVALFFIGIGTAVSQENVGKKTGNGRETKPDNSSREAERASKRNDRESKDGNGGYIIRERHRPSRTDGGGFIYDDPNEDNDDIHLEEAVPVNVFLSYSGNLRCAPLGFMMGFSSTTPYKKDKYRWFYFALKAWNYNTVNDRNDYSNIYSFNQVRAQYPDDTYLGIVKQEALVFDLGVAYDLPFINHFGVWFGLGIGFVEDYHKLYDSLQELTFDGNYYVLHQRKTALALSTGLYYYAKFGLMLHVGYDHFPQSLVVGAGFRFLSKKEK